MTDNPFLIHQTRIACRKTSLRLSFLALAAVLNGCSTESGALQEAMKRVQTAQNSTHLAAISEQAELNGFDGEVSDDALNEGPAAEAIPVAGEYGGASGNNRKNPFEFGEGIDVGAPQVRKDEQLNLKLFGFVGDEQAKAIVHVEGKTRMLAAGDKWGAIEVVDVSPPNVRIRIDGVLRAYSVLGKQSSQLDP